MQTAVQAEGLEKAFGRVQALRGLDLHVQASTVCGILGPNGAGKTTAVRILTTLLRLDGGRAEVAGVDVRRSPREVRARIGLVGQHAAVDEVLSARQNLELFGRLFHLTPPAARHRAVALLEEFGLDPADDRPVKQHSGGMRRRLDLAAGLILAPPVLFLDEPTTGLDPRGRAEVWNAVRALVRGGTTVVLTTQYLDEADQLADRITVVDHGRAVADGSPDELKARLGGDRIDVVVRDASDLTAAAELLGRIAGASATVDADDRRASVPAADAMAALADVVRALAGEGIVAEDLVLRRPTLDEVFLQLTEGVPA
jgi:ABC-2 type transport system ATP-binding protein